METKVASEKLRQAVNIANRFISLRPTLPVLANLKLESEKTKLRITSTNLENSVILEVPAVGEVWETTVPAKLLVELLNLVKSSDTMLTVEKESLSIKAGETIGSFNTIAASEYPKVSKVEGKGVSLEQKTLSNALADIAFAASVDPGKPVLNGILVRSKEDKTLLVATDSYRLAQYGLEESFNIGDTIVPARAFVEAVKIAGEMGEEIIDMHIGEEGNQIFLSGVSFQISVRLIDGVYPAFEQIIPKEFVSEVVFEKEELANAVKQTAVFARDTGNVIKFFINTKGEIKVWASTKQVGEGSTKLKGEVSGEDLEVAFNSHFFLEGLEALNGKKVKIKFSGSLKPAIIESGEEKNFSYLVMPVKPQN